MTRPALLAAALALAGCGPARPPDPAPAAPPAASAPPAPPTTAAPAWFEDKSAGCGIDAEYRNGEDRDLYTILESLGGGVALVDYDRDGRLDVFVTGGGGFTRADPPGVEGRPNRLYRNLGGWRFADVTAAAGLDRTVFYSHGAAVGDYDRDGWPDLFVTGYGRVALYRNESGPGGRTFREVTREAGLPEALPWSTSAAFGDLDGDGYPELFVCQYVDWSPAAHRTCPHHDVPRDVCTPHAFRPLRPYLFRNTGDGRFEDVSDRHRLRADGRGLGVVIADLDGDGRPDVYVANDASPNHLYLNRPGFVLEEVGMARGVAVDETGHENGSMGIAVGDWDRSGRPSLVVTNFQGEFHALYQNLGGGRFLYQSHPSGLTRLGQRYVGFGTAFADFDADGWDDLIVANGHVLRHPVGSDLAQFPVLMRNEESGARRALREVGTAAGPYFRVPRRGRGLAVGDLDGDARPDVVITHQNAPPAVLRNRSGDPDRPGNRVAGFELHGVGGRSTIGAKVAVSCGGILVTRFATAGGYLSESDSRVYFGLGSLGTVDRVTVDWPFGPTQTWDGPIPVGRVWRLREGNPAIE